MYEVVWQFDEHNPLSDINPANADEARRLLVEGNHAFAQFFGDRAGGDVPRRVIRVSPQEVGLGGVPGEAPAQEPFAAFLSCADARVPVEMIFGQQANDLFVVRVAGNVLGSECLGSLDYAVDRLGTVRLVAALGHTSCGAVTAAVDAYLTPAGYLGVAANFPLSTIISALMAPARGAAHALTTVHGRAVTEQPGYRQALIETTVVLNSALCAAVLVHTFDGTLGDRLDVLFGVYDMGRRTVGLPALAEEGDEWHAGLFRPPTDEAEFEEYGAQVAASRYIRALLATPAAASRP